MKVFELPGPRGAGTIDAVGLGFCEALAGCSLLHCFSESLLGILASFAGEKLLPGLCVSLSRWPGEEGVGQLRRLCRRPAMKVVCQSLALQEALVAGGVPAENCSVIHPQLSAKERAGQRLMRWIIRIPTGPCRIANTPPAAYLERWEKWAY